MSLEKANFPLQRAVTDVFKTAVPCSRKFLLCVQKQINSSAVFIFILFFFFTWQSSVLLEVPTSVLSCLVLENRSNHSYEF